MAFEQSRDQEEISLFKYSKRVILKTIVCRSDGGIGLIGRRVVVGGWVKSSRESKVVEPKAHAPEVVPGRKDITCVEVFQTRMPFLRSIIKAFGVDIRVRDKLDNANALPKPPPPSISIMLISDGSCITSLQVVVDSGLAPPSQVMPTGTCVLAEGVLQIPSLKGKHVIELKADKILHIGTVDQDRYPLSRKRIPLESLRDHAHFRPRTTTVACVMRIRNALTQATHAFFHENGFLHVQVPVITTANSGFTNQNMFHVTAPLDGTETNGEQAPTDDFEAVKLEIIRSSIEEKTQKVEELRRSSSNKEAMAAAIHDLKKTNELAAQMEAKRRRIKTGKPGHRLETSCSPWCFTVSGRMHLESYASALGNVCAFGPRFCANGPPVSKKVLAEMWVAEVEMAFSELQDSIDCAIDFLRFVCKWVSANCAEDLKFMFKRVDKLIFDRLKSVETGPFEKISYTEAINVLNQVTERTFETKVEWGVSLNDEHEGYLSDEIYKKPLIIYNHPKELKSFNVRANDDGKTCSSFDVIVPKVGIVVRGSQSEWRHNMLSTRIKKVGMDPKQYEWYMELRNHGKVDCSGFSFLLDPMVLYATGLNDVRDAVPFPMGLAKPNN